MKSYWLGRYKATIECREERIFLKGTFEEDVRYRKCPKGHGWNPASILELWKLVRQGHPLYLCHISQEEKKELNPNDVIVVVEFVDVLLEEIIGVPPQWEIDFTIDLVPGMRPILKLHIVWLRTSWKN